MAQWRLCGSAYRGQPQEAALHTQYLIHISSPSTVDNEGGGWLATGPIGYASGFSFSSYVEADNRQVRAVNRGLISDEYFFYLLGDRLFRCDYTTTEDSSVDGFVGNTWSIVHTFTNMEAGRTGRNTGIYSVLIREGEESKKYVIGTYNSTVAGANTWKGFKHNVAAGTTTETNSVNLGFAAPANQGAIKAEILHDDKLFFIGDTNGGVGIYDPQSNVLYRNAWPTSDISGPHDFCSYNGELYCLNRAEYGAGGGSGMYIWRVSSSGISQAINFAINGYRTPSFASEPYEGRCLLFTDNTYLYAATLAYDGSTTATRFFRFTQNVDRSLSWDGVHPSVTYGDNAGSWQVRLNSFNDQNTNPDGSTNITINIDQHGATGCYRHQWVFAGPSSAFVEEDSTQGLTLHELRETARSHCKSGGGERIFAPSYGGPRAEITNFDLATQAGFVKVEYEIFNNPYDFPAGTPCSIQLRYSADKHIPYNRGTLDNPSAGTLTENSTVVVIAASESGTTYSFEWDYASAGLAYTDRPNVAILVSTTGTS